MHLNDLIQVKIVETRDEFIKAAEIVYDRYFHAGYIRPNKFNLWLTHFQLLPESETVIALIDNKILATVSYLDGSKVRIPADYTFPERIKKLRNRNKKFVELIGLANIGIFDVFVKLIYKTFKLLDDKGFELVIVETNPRREKIFSRFGLKVISKIQDNFLVEAPTLLMIGNIIEILNKIESKAKWLSSI